MSLDHVSLSGATRPPSNTLSSYKPSTYDTTYE